MRKPSAERLQRFRASGREGGPRQPGKEETFIEIPESKGATHRLIRGTSSLDQRQREGACNREEAHAFDSAT